MVAYIFLLINGTARPSKPQRHLAPAKETVPAERRRRALPVGHKVIKPNQRVPSLKKD